MAQGNGSFPKSLIWVVDQLGEYEGEGNMLRGKYAVTNVQMWSYRNETQKYKFENGQQR